jgi:hypothetical protein
MALLFYPVERASPPAIYSLKVQIAQAGKPVPPMPFMALGEPEAHEWLVPKLCLGTLTIL